MRVGNLLLVAAVVVLAVVVGRVVMGGPPGPKTVAVTVLGVVLLVSGLFARRRERVAQASGTPPASR